ncbi:CRP/FNR family transcriptional regulator [Catenibacillus scindens]|uniref:CRP/FNR family transcriptional regulator n=1 Tax=Catenibacillus scindens TaxID=673271 RepID=A0A7W8HAE1_9FIRM|nr:Crp/Fnr family transcriptional regulator [Catenibacillus scindens]MBB5264703.1 CRP/FNR family transcriptional regulator [Catenibacillus scindens]
MNEPMKKQMALFFPFWEGLSSQWQEQLAGNASIRHYPKGSVIHQGRQDCLGILLILSGQIRAYINTEEGRELTLYRLFDGDICLFTASCVFNSIQFDIFVTPVQDVSVIHIPADVYRSCLEENARAALYTNELMASRFSEVMWVLEQVLSKKLDERLAALLLEEEYLSGSTDLALTHEQIANHLGSAREVISRMLKYFQSEGLVRLSRGHVHLTDLAGLTALAAEK